MSINIHLQNCRGGGHKLKVSSAILHLGNCKMIVGEIAYLSIEGGLLELYSKGVTRQFELGEGFASVRNFEITLMVDEFIEFVSGSPDKAARDNKSATVPRCIVCDNVMNSKNNAATVNGKRLHVCCPDCADTFIHARRILGKIDGTCEVDTP